MVDHYPVDHKAQAAPDEGGPEMEHVLSIKNVEKYYGSKSSLTKALDGISFNVDRGEFVAIMGASGSGKTTLLNCISTIDRVTAGEIYLEDTNVTLLRGKELNRFRRDKLGFIFQDFNLLDTLTGYENIAINKQKPTNTQNIHPKVFLHPSNKNPNTTSNPFIIQPNSPPPTQRRTIKSRIPIIENISMIIVSPLYFHILVQMSNAMVP